MFSQPPVNASDRRVDVATERSVESDLQARREEFAQGLTRYTAWICAAMSVMLGGMWLLAPTYPQLLIYAGFILLLALAAGLYPAFRRRNRTTAGLFLMSGLSLVVVFFIPLLLPDLLPVVGLWDVIAIMVVKILLGNRGSRWLVGAFALSYMTDVVVVGILGWSLFSAFETTELWATGVVSLVGILTAILIISLIVLGLEQQFRRAQRLNLELEGQIQAVNETQEALSRERNMLRTLIDHIPDYIFIKDNSKRFMVSNLAQAHAAGVTAPSELLGHPADLFFPAEIVAQPNVDDEAVLLGASILAQERQTVNEDGTMMWVSTTKVPLRDVQGGIIGIVGISRDISAHKQAEEALRQERNLLRLLIDTVPANVYIKDAQGHFVEANLETALQMGVKTSNDLIGKTDFDFFNAELAGPYLANEQAIVQSGQPLRNIEELSFDYRTQRENWFLTTKVPILDEDGRVTGLVGVSLDITERKRIEKALEEERTLLRTLIDAMPDYIYIKDRAGRFVIGNTATALSLGAATPDEIVGKTDFDFHAPELAARFFAEEQALLQSGKPLLNQEEVVIDQRTGKRQYLLSTNVPLYDSQGQITGLVGVNRDITERKQAEQQGLDLRNERQRVQVLHQFIGDATHDLMTPIAGINLSADLARRAPDRERLIVHLDKIDSLSLKLQNRLQDMFTMSQLDMMTAQELELRTVDLAQLLRRLVETYRPRAQAKAQQLTGEVDPQAGTLQVDDLYLIMALAKVVENAIHYTDNGGTIHIAITRHEGQVAIAVRDTGIGIVEADLAHIFDRFYRAKDHRPLDVGSGLGLSIAQRIVELHRGRIEVSSVVGSGSTFTVLLPSD